GPDGKPWGLDLINGRIWAVEDGFWTPQAEARSPTKPTSLAGGLRGIFFLAGPGWLGSFDSEGQRLWLWDKDLAGNPLPADPRLTSGPQGLYLLSASGQRLWYFPWSKLSAPAKRVVPPTAATVFGWVDQRLGQLTDQLHYPEAEALAAYALAYGEDQLRSDPFNPELRSSLAHLKSLRSDLREARVGFGTLSLRWDLHTGVPYADWTLTADQSAASGPIWFRSLTQWRPGLPSPPPSQEGPLPRTALATTWPGLPELRFAKAYYPGLVEILLTHPDSGQRAYFRFSLPYPNLPDPPDDRPQVPGLPSRGSALGGQ
ncbi:MAG: hypothetical protein PHV85_10830, partial [Desulfovibrionaceae bacterium]|nr:hypothetical protein [Desulfovibrionaceae bacterium]